MRGLKHRGSGVLVPGPGSHPSRVRGLKQGDGYARVALKKVAPFTGAWIETRYGYDDLKLKLSHPSRVRGLKRLCLDSVVLGVQSHPSRVRGLKRIGSEQIYKYEKSHPSRVRGLKHRLNGLGKRFMGSHPSRVRGLKPPHLLYLLADPRRTLHGCVD